MKRRKVAILSLLIALAMVFSFVESQIPSPIAIPGVKIGLANLAVIFTLNKLGMKEAIIVSLVRVFIIAVLFGSAVSLVYSTSGAVLSLLSMYLLMKTHLFSSVAISVTGGVMHNLGQVIIACILLESNILKYYFPFLLISGVASGIAIGLLSNAVIERINIE